MVIQNGDFIFDITLTIAYAYSVRFFRKELGMLEVNVKEVRRNLSELLDKVENGEVILISRHGKQIARLTPSKRSTESLPSLKDFRARLQIQGRSLSETVIELRENERY